MSPTQFPFSMSSGVVSLQTQPSSGIRQELPEVKFASGVRADLHYAAPSRILENPRKIDIQTGKSSCAELELPEGGRVRIWLVVEELSLVGYDCEGAPMWRIDRARCIHETTLAQGTEVADVPPRSTQS